jgi:hypothetical protein
MLPEFIGANSQPLVNRHERIASDRKQQRHSSVAQLRA